MPVAVERCVKSILKENPGMPEERAWKICQAAQKKGLLEKRTSTETFEDVCPECHDTLTLELMRLHKISKEQASLRALKILNKLSRL